MCHKQQRGSALVVAIFVIVVLGFLAAALSRLVVSSSDSVVTEVLGARAFQVAQSGVEQAMLEAFPLGAEPITDCDQLDSSSVDMAELNGPGLEDCQVNLSCLDASLASQPIFQVSVTGQCSAGSKTATRTISVEVSGL